MDTTSWPSVEKVTRVGVRLEWDHKEGQEVVHEFPDSLLQSPQIPLDSTVNRK